MIRGKKYSEVSNKVDKTKTYSVEEAINLLLETHYTKFDSTVDIAVKLGIDPRQANQQIRTALLLPHGIGKDIKVLVFAKDEKAQEAKDAGADYVGLDDLVDKISNQNWLDFDVAIATPDVMSEVGKLGKFLGPRSLMPSPKVGTVTNDIENVVAESKAGRIEIKNDKGGVIHAPIGKVTFGYDKLRENFLVFMDSLRKIKPTSSKGMFIRKVTISSTMGPGINVDVIDLRDVLKNFELAA